MQTYQPLQELFSQMKCAMFFQAQASSYVQKLFTFRRVIMIGIGGIKLHGDTQPVLQCTMFMRTNPIS